MEENVVEEDDDEEEDVEEDEMEEEEEEEFGLAGIKKTFRRLKVLFLRGALRAIKGQRK